MFGRNPQPQPRRSSFTFQVFVLLLLAGGAYLFREDIKTFIDTGEIPKEPHMSLSTDDVPEQLPDFGILRGKVAMYSNPERRGKPFAYGQAGQRVKIVEMASSSVVHIHHNGFSAYVSASSVDLSTQE